ncbi:DUF1292 domain-containing protein [Desmospora profundinema]|uniref:UPF0473 protein JOE21_001180 n=1 Tax=Desmospora profundinema TaxID=1571184 RepID=A0ABU1IM09_9BACL|nr:DUF1292 domain-containing protein [Desmospora profundinema]MDR6225189.1 uncharacterized protein YrzB (UPF0473 family) [Desmospora profundinema]
MDDNGQHENMTETVLISNEDGQQETFEVLFRFEQDNGNKYILLTPLDETQGEGNENEEEAVEQEVYAFRYEGDGENINLIPIEDDGEWDMVEEVLRTLEDQLQDESM